MGLHPNVKKLIDENALSAIEIKQIEDYAGSVVVINASLTLNRFLVALDTVRLSNESGEITTYVCFYLSIDIAKSSTSCFI